MESQSTSTRVEFTSIYLGDLVSVCVACGTATDCLMMGLATAEHDEASSEIIEFETAGVIIYPCHHTFVSPCLTDKVGMILNEYEEGYILVERFANLISCEEHGDFENGGEEYEDE